ncbi:hypothetical protein Q2T76_01635 [Lactobacillus sp. YT155]|uniref:hypothetical protein n=1 Tax=Lactobacillus sp. YT155 TaxID=3060955 RepID=UPI00265F6627|nr:hypothetical protein [Lactobacillus sp. YT155]MDO1604753.1 hypothetical protein [Lactobacillus sp. YT155]
MMGNKIIKLENYKQLNVEELRDRDDFIAKLDGRQIYGDEDFFIAMDSAFDLTDSIISDWEQFSKAMTDLSWIEEGREISLIVYNSDSFMVDSGAFNEFEEHFTGKDGYLEFWDKNARGFNVYLVKDKDPDEKVTRYRSDYVDNYSVVFKNEITHLETYKDLDFEKFKQENSYIVQLDGSHIKNIYDFYEDMMVGFNLPEDAADGRDYFYDWMLRLKWIRNEKIVLIVYNCEKFLPSDYDEFEEEFIGEDGLLPYWGSGGVYGIFIDGPKDFQVFMVEDIVPNTNIVGYENKSLWSEIKEKFQNKQEDEGKESTEIIQLLHKLEEKGEIDLEEGMSKNEIERVEKELDISFPVEIREVYEEVMPSGGGFYSWKNLSDDELDERRDYILRTKQEFLRRYEEIHWPDSYFDNGLNKNRPKFKKRLMAAPKLIPLREHRFMVSGMNNGPLLSVDKTDVTYYGASILQGIKSDFPSPQEYYGSIYYKDIKTKIPFWSEMIEI